MPLTAAPFPRFRPHTWCDTKTGKPVHGIQAQLGPHQQWRHLAEDGKPLFFTSQRARDRKITTLTRRAERDGLRMTKAKISIEPAAASHA